MRRLRFLIPGLTLVTVLVLILRFSAAEGSYRVYVPVGYVNEANRMIRENKLDYDCETERIAAAGLSSDEEYFYRNSYLKQDVDAWNGGDRRPFLVEREALLGGGCEGQVLEANANYHKQRLPTYEADSWKGNLYLHQSIATTSLISAERTIEVVDAPWPILPLPAQAFEDVWFRQRSPGIRSQQLAFKMLEAGRAFATLKNVGSEAALEITGDRPSLALNGCPVPLGWRVRLDGGDVLRVLHTDRSDEHYNVETGRRASLVSYVSLINGEPRRKTFTDRLPMARNIAYAIDAAVVESQDLEGATARDDFDVYLTLDSFLNHRLERQLASFCRQRYGKRPLRAAVTVMEPESGRVLALASYPDANNIEDLAVTSASQRDLLSLNHNFLHHAVGSAAKPFLAAAALATRPELASLRIPCFAAGEPPEQLLGYQLGTYNLPPDCQGADSNGKIDLEGFMTVSSNRFILIMGLLAMAEWNNGPLPDRGAPDLEALDRYSIGGREFRQRPVLPIARTDASGFTELKDVGAEQFMFNFRDLFDFRVAYRKAPLVEGLELDYWRPVVDATLSDASHPAMVSFSPVTPVEVNLRANLMQNLRQDLYTTLLGAGNNRWTNLQLAQALSRLVTGRPVQGRLLEKVEVPADGSGKSDNGASPAGPSQRPAEVLWDLETELAEDSAAPFLLADNLRRPVIDAMRSVVEKPNGTAYQLQRILRQVNQEAPQGVSYRALAKTGTPTATYRSVQRGPTTPSPASIEVYSGRRQVKSGVLVLAVERVEGRETQSLAISVRIEAQGGSEEAVALTATFLRPLIEAYWPEDWLKTPNG